MPASLNFGAFLYMCEDEFMQDVLLKGNHWELISKVKTAEARVIIISTAQTSIRCTTTSAN